MLIHRSRCRGCDSPDLALVLDLGPMPLAGGFETRPEPPSPRFSLVLYRCERCTLLQILDFVPSDVLFRHYLYQSSTTMTLREHFRALAHTISDIVENKTDLIVEIGSNDGVLLRPLRDLGLKPIGVDPAANVSALARREGLEVIEGYFSPTIADELRADRGAARVVTASNVLAHIDDMESVLEGIRRLLHRDGYLICEVHYAGDLLSLNQFDTIYHEHLCYYSVTAMQSMLRRYGLTVVNVQRIPIHSGSIRVWAQHQDRAAPLDAVGVFCQRESNADHVRFSKEVPIVRDAIVDAVVSAKAAGRNVAAYGAPGRGTILLNYCELTSEVLDFATDESDLRQGRFIPGTGIPIVAPSALRDDPRRVALMLAWNYESEILGKEGEFLRKGGSFIVPLPWPHLIPGPRA